MHFFRRETSKDGRTYQVILRFRYGYGYRDYAPEVQGYAQELGPKSWRRNLPKPSRISIVNRDSYYKQCFYRISMEYELSVGLNIYEEQEEMDNRGKIVKTRELMLSDWHVFEDISDLDILSLCSWAMDAKGVAELKKFLGDIQSDIDMRGPSSEWYCVPELCFDLDSKKDLELARVQTVRLLDAVQELNSEYQGPGVTPKKKRLGVHIVFSGSKGFHLHFPIHESDQCGWEHHQFMESIARILKTRLDLTCLDTKIYDKARVLRIPGTLNRKSNLMCVTISEKMLRNSSADEIRNYAEQMTRWHRHHEDPDNEEYEYVCVKPEVYTPKYMKCTLNLVHFFCRLCQVKYRPYKTFEECRIRGGQTITKADWKGIGVWDARTYIQCMSDFKSAQQRFNVPTKAGEENHVERTERVKTPHDVPETEVISPTQEFTDFMSRTNVSVNRQFTMSETVNFLKTYDFRELFGLPIDGTNFCCWYHEDATPSARVIIPTPERPYYYYRCFANPDEHPSKTIIDLAKDYFHCDFGEAVRRLSACFGIEIVSGRNEIARDRARDAYEELKDLLSEAGLNYRLDLHFEVLDAFFEYALELLTNLDVTPEGFFFTLPTSILADRVGKDRRSICMRTNLLNCLGIIQKVNPNDVPIMYRYDHFAQKVLHRYGSEPNWYRFTTNWDIDAIVGRYQLWIEHNGSDRRADQATLAEVFGIDAIGCYELKSYIDVCDRLRRRVERSTSPLRRQAFQARLDAYLRFLQDVEHEHYTRTANTIVGLGTAILNNDTRVVRSLDLFIWFLNLKEQIFLQYFTMFGLRYHACTVEDNPDNFAALERCYQSLLSVI